MSKAFEIKLTVQVDLELTAGEPSTYIERFTVPLNDEYDSGEVLAAVISFMGAFQHDLRRVGAVVSAANRAAGPLPPGTL